MDIPRFTFPPLLGRLHAMLPQYPPSLAFVTALNVALGKTIPRETLEPLWGRNLRIRVTDAGLALNFTLTEKGFSAIQSGGEPDLTISAAAYDFLVLALRKEDPDTLFFSRRLLMEGDTELGLLVKNTLDALEVPPLDIKSLLPGRVLGNLKNKLLVGAVHHQ
jgi:predicted lipid carrier protein YhbT